MKVVVKSSDEKIEVSQMKDGDICFGNDILFICKEHLGKMMIFSIGRNGTYLGFRHSGQQAEVSYLSKGTKIEITV